MTPERALLLMIYCELCLQDKSAHWSLRFFWVAMYGVATTWIIAELCVHPWSWGGAHA